MDINTSIPKGIRPPGTTRQVRGDDDQRAVADKPSEIPVSIVYKRHSNPNYDPEKVPPMATSPRELLGWTVDVNCHTFSTRIKIKICRNPHRLEVWVDNERVATSTKGRGEWILPDTEGFDLPEESLAAWFNGEPTVQPTPGWASRLGQQHQVAKQAELRKTQPRPVPDGPHCSKCLKKDEGDLVPSNGILFCMVCYLRGGQSV